VEFEEELPAEVVCEAYAIAEAYLLVETGEFDQPMSCEV
jgi:hypothetical protein